MLRKPILIPLFLLVTAALACNLPGAGGAPTVTVSAPPNGAQVAAGQIVEVVYHAEDAQEIARVDMTANGNLVATQSPAVPGQATVSGILRWTPEVPGSYNLILTAYNAGGQASDPTGVSITVVQAVAGMPTPTLVPAFTPTTPGQPTQPGAGPTATPRPGQPTNTPKPPTATARPGQPTNTPEPPTATARPGQPTNTPKPPTATARPGQPTNTPKPPTATHTPTKTNTAQPPTATHTPTKTNTPPPPEIVFFTGPVTVERGDLVTLEWETRNADCGVVLDTQLSFYEVRKTGSTNEFPDVTTTYTLIAQGAPCDNPVEVPAEWTVHVVVRGSEWLSNNHSLDLGDGDGDVIFIHSSSDVELFGASGALLKTWYGGLPSAWDCTSYINQGGFANVVTIQRADNICYKTGSGNYGYLVIKDWILDPLDRTYSLVEIEYETEITITP